MKFAMIREYSWDLSKDKIILGEINKSYIAHFTDGTSKPSKLQYKISIAYLLKMGSFDENNEYNILVNTDSIQIRPKAIYKNEKGYYKKDDGKRVFFNEDEVKEIEESIDKFKKYIKDNPEIDVEDTKFKEIQ